MAVRVPTNSYLRFSDYLSMAGVEFWELADLPEIPEQVGDLTHTVKDTDRIDLLADQYYDDPVAKWVIAKANDIEIVPTELNPGDVLRIPSPRWVKQRLFEKAK